MRSRLKTMQVPAVLILGIVLGWNLRGKNMGGPPTAALDARASALEPAALDRLVLSRSSQLKQLRRSVTVGWDDQEALLRENPLAVLDKIPFETVEDYCSKHSGEYYSKYVAPLFPTHKGEEDTLEFVKEALSVLKPDAGSQSKWRGTGTIELGGKTVDFTLKYRAWISRPEDPGYNLSSLKGKNLCFDLTLDFPSIQGSTIGSAGCAESGLIQKGSAYTAIVNLFAREVSPYYSHVEVELPKGSEPYSGFLRPFSRPKKEWQPEISVKWEPELASPRGSETDRPN